MNGAETCGGAGIDDKTSVNVPSLQAQCSAGRAADTKNTLDDERGGADIIEDISGNRNMTGDVPDKDSS